MMYNSAKLCLTVSLLCMVVVSPDDNRAESISQSLPPLETFLLEPIEVEKPKPITAPPTHLVEQLCLSIS